MRAYADQITATMMRAALPAGAFVCPALTTTTTGTKKTATKTAGG